MCIPVEILHIYPILLSILITNVIIKIFSINSLFINYIGQQIFYIEAPKNNYLCFFVIVSLLYVIFLLLFLQLIILLWH